MDAPTERTNGRDDSAGGNLNLGRVCIRKSFAAWVGAGHLRAKGESNGNARAMCRMDEIFVSSSCRSSTRILRPDFTYDATLQTCRTLTGPPATLVFLLELLVKVMPPMALTLTLQVSRTFSPGRRNVNRPKHFLQRRRTK